MDTTVVAQWLVETAWQSAVLVVFIWIAQMLLRRWLSPAWRCALWGVVAIRLVIPVLPSSAVSVYGLLAGHSSQQEQSRPLVAMPVQHIEVHPAPVEVALPVAPPTMRTIVPAPVPSTPTWESLVVTVWLSVMGLLLARRFVQAMALRRLRRAATPCGVPCAVPVLESDRIRTPALAGLLRPCVLLPQGAIARLAPEQLALVIEHEMTHLRRHDHWGRAAAAALQAMHWFNPFVHFAFSRHRLECELACDRAVLDAQRVPGRRVTYGKTLLDLATWTPPGRQFATVAMAEGSRHLKARIAEIAADRPGRGSVVAGIVTALLLVACGLTQAQTAETPVGAIPPATRPATAPTDGADQLARRLPEVQFNGLRLEDAVAYLRDAAELYIVVDWPQLKQIGVTPESRVQTRLRDVRVDKCLDELCRQAATSGRDHGVWVFDRGVVTITTLSAMSVFVTKVYDVTDIVGPLWEQWDADPAKRLAEVSDLLTSTVEVFSWEGKGGRGTARIFQKNNCLIISQTQDVHTQVEALLAKLRERTALAVDVQLRTIELPTRVLPAYMRETLAAGKPQGWYPSDSQVDDLVKTAKAHRQDAVMSAPRMVMVNGESAKADIWTDVNYLGNVKATTRPGAAPVYEPEISATRSGLGVMVSSFISHDRKSIRIQLKSQAKRVLSMGEVSYKPVADAKESFTIQQPVTNEASFEESVMIEDGKTVCLWGQVTSPTDSKSEPRVLLLMVTPTIIDTTKLPKPQATTRSMGVPSLGQ